MAAPAWAQAPGPLLVVDRLSKRFGGLHAVNEVSFTVAAGTIKGLIGPNGAGKTTLFNLVSGVFPPTSGAITFLGAGIAGQKPHRIAQRGIARTFQNIQLFDNMTVLENVMVGCHTRSRAGMVAAALRLPFTQTEESVIIEQALAMLNLVGLTHRAGDQAGSLPFGQQRLLEIARALAAQPRVLLLDEPASGLNTAERMSLDRLIRQINRDLEMTILLVEHDIQLVMDLVDEVMVLDHGEKIADGSPEAVQADARVIQAYLGSSQ